MSAPKHSILKRFAAMSLIALVVAAAAALFSSHVYNSHDVMNDAKKIVDVAAGETQALVSDLTQEDLTHKSESANYKDTRSSLRLICNLLNIRSLYIYGMSDAQTSATYVLALASDDVSDEVIKEYAASGGKDTLKHGFVQETRALSGEADPTPEVTQNYFGRNLTWYYPVTIDAFDEPFVLRIDIDDTAITRNIIDNTLVFAIPMIVINALVVLLEVAMLKHDVSNPLHVLSNRMRGFVQSEASRQESMQQEPLKIGKDDEISDIADSYNTMTKDIHQYVGQIESMTQERVATATELDIARRIQQGLVPPTTEIAGSGFEAYAFMRMAREVGGDFYDLSRLKDGTLLFMLADVSGKGVSAALFMAMSRTLLNEKLQSYRDPAKALNEANDIIASNNPENMFVTLVAGIFDPQTGTLTYANAGHTPPLVVGKGFLSPDPGIAVGLFEDAGIVNETIQLEPGDGILFYTDGATDATNASNQFFGEDHLAHAPSGASHPKDAIRAVVEAIDCFVAGHEQFDDLTLLSLFVLEDGERHE